MNCLYSVQNSKNISNSLSPQLPELLIPLYVSFCTASWLRSSALPFPPFVSDHVHFLTRLQHWIRLANISHATSALRLSRSLFRGRERTHCRVLSVTLNSITLNTSLGSKTLRILLDRGYPPRSHRPSTSLLKYYFTCVSLSQSHFPIVFPTPFARINRISLQLFPEMPLVLPPRPPPQVNRASQQASSSAPASGDSAISCK